MNVVTFENCLILDIQTGTSQRGNFWVRYKFLEQTELEVFDLMAFGDSAAAAASLSRGVVLSLAYKVVPDRNGGVRLELVQVGPVS